MAVVADQMAFPMHAVAAGAVLLPFMREMRIELRIQFLSALGEIVIGTMARQALVHGWLFRRIAAFMAGSARQILVAALAAPAASMKPETIARSRAAFVIHFSYGWRQSLLI